MEQKEEEATVHSEVIDQICNIFGDVLHRDVVLTVVESCGGDFIQSMEALINITSESPNQNVESSCTEQVKPTINAEPELKAQNIEYNQLQPIVSYAAASQSKGVPPKVDQSKSQTQCQPKKMPYDSSYWTDQISQIITHYNQGYRVFIIMRGAPGSGKSNLAKKVLEMTVGSGIDIYKTHIFSADDFFIVRGQYQFQKSLLPEAHARTQNHVSVAANDGVSPIIVDNTNIELWEMEPYARNAIKNGYFLDVLEPNTAWAKNAHQLSKMNIHNVPKATISRMLNNYQEGITGEYLKDKFKLVYPTNMVPPILRNIPPIMHNAVVIDSVQKNAGKHSGTEHTIDNPGTSTVNVSKNFFEKLPEQVSSSINVKSAQSNTVEGTQKDPSGLSVSLPISKDLVHSTDEENPERYQLVMEVQKHLEEMVKIEEEWDNGEHWEDITGQSTSGNVIDSDPKPPRKVNKSEQNTTNKLLDSENKGSDWSNISMFIPPWQDDTSSKASQKFLSAVESISTGTCMELGDTDILNNKNNFKIITATARDINEFYTFRGKEKIPQKLMLHKSSSTNEHVTEAYRCKNEEKHFLALCRLFKNIPKSNLRDVFDNCGGDVNWTVEIIFGSMSDKEIEMVETDDTMSDTDEEITQCDCLAAYNIVPDGDRSPLVKTFNVVDNEIENACGQTQIKKKTKKDVNQSESSLQLKKQIEKNIVISEDFYSNHCSMIRKMRHGEYIKEENLDQPSTSGMHINPPLLENDSFENESDTEDTMSNVSTEELEKIVPVHIGMDFVNSLDNMFGRKDMNYPNGIIPKISLPISLLNELNALWMQSFIDQMDQASEKIEMMVKQDEEFARQLVRKEEELMRAGKEPEVPDFKEIMDLDLALSLYHKDVDKWRDNEPNDLAAKLTRDKLFNLFPEVSTDTLSEILMAYENNFQATVEALLVSTGRSDVLEDSNGINKFVMQKEMERQENILKEQRKALSEEEWPLLSKNVEVNMDTVNGFRDDAESHLLRRNINYNKAQEYIQRGITQAALYFSEVAAYHKLKYEYCNSLAAATLIQVHALNNPDSGTIDLHFFRVREAREALDIFVDTHIQKLREARDRGGPRVRDLYFITGRGRHSQGKPKLKPAVKKRLNERGFHWCERNPGLLVTQVCADHKLSHQLVVP